ncbi:EAL domain-containing protein [Deferribacter thermophilus]|uniref:bifunctional diguanylate cyclase/phosphodiesterase n=1 Tax=Deferribacter thermophilus TaxID=53573 RepID=UPI003C1D50C4
MFKKLMFCNLLKKISFNSDEEFSIEIKHIFCNFDDKPDIDFINNNKEIIDNYKKMLSGNLTYFIYELPHETNLILYSSLLKRDESEIETVEFLISAESELGGIVNGLINNKYIGLIIYQDDKIKFVDKGFEYITGYSFEEVKEKNLSSLFHDYAKESIKYLSILRQRGKYIEQHFSHIPLLAKDGFYKYLNLYDSTTDFRGDKAGCMIFFDVTEEKYLSDVNRIQLGLNKIFSKIKYKKDLFKGICDYLVSLPDIRFAWIGEVKKDGVYPIFYSGYNEGYIKVLKLKINDPETSKGPTISSIKRGNISVNPNTKENPAVHLWRDEMLKRRFFSSCAIPIKYEDEYKYVVNIYAGEPYYFNEKVVEALKNLQEDISDFLVKLDELEFKEYLYSAIENSHDWVMITDKNGKIEYINKALENISGYSKDEIIGKTPAIFKSGLYDSEFYKRLWDTILNGEVFNGVVINKKKNGEFFQLDHTIVPVKIDGKVTKFVSIAKDITREVTLEEEIKRFKYFDTLTNLYNRKGFVLESTKALEKYGMLKGIKVVLLIDIHSFSYLNEVYGFKTCDELLRKYGEILKNTFYNTDIVARVSSDEFAIFLMINKEEELTHILDKLFETNSKPIKIGDDLKIKIDINVGVKILNDLDVEDALSKAELSANLAKKEGANTFRVYNEEINKRISQHYDTLQLILDALKNRWFIFHLQPIYNVNDLDITGFEALIRINHPEKGVIYPNVFIDLVENSSLLEKFETHLFQMIIDYLNKINFSARNYEISINVSVNSFKNNLIEKYIKIIPEHMRNNINIEITERVFAEDNEKIINILNKVKDSGFKIEIDDFGTGYSSLSYMERIPADIIKIDMSFTQKLESCFRTKAIVKTIIQLAQNLGLKTIAEGVETKEQFEILKSLGCDYVQGYYFSKPLPLDKIISLIK